VVKLVPFDPAVEFISEGSERLVTGGVRVFSYLGTSSTDKVMLSVDG
jgi:hypothetical protein